MSRMMIQAAVTMNQLQKKLDIVGNNIANSQTTGYKSRGAEFSSLLYQQIDNLENPGNGEQRLTPDGIRIGSGARLGATTLNLDQGSIVTSDRALDTALLNENTLFQIQVTDNGVTETMYTRDGAFYISPSTDGRSVTLTTKDGNPVLGENGPITFNSGFDSISIRDNGQVVVERGGIVEEVGTIDIVEATRPNVLEAVGQNLFRLPNLGELNDNLADIIQDVPAQTKLIQSNALEQSNVDISQQMSDLILAQRSYQYNSRTISMSDQMMGLVNGLRS
ncbi:flagellar hook-basal body protein [Oceanobacillus caeni]|uniref:flagellar hook-basal body protein n=1 Tax=Oceanobacillus TaxID=182709 RepID=UPI0006221C05|nr:flagellar hook-basal body protein [Oceanobacillus caeni]KKE80436.1 flagellar hook-basal body protein [Bacilli bacterium VT-13-104]PZD83362.1 flagellar hook-basal body protein [Bacilli bacterium]MCR1834325.1 flagellar hook-basal body protein [Oceanobacillus caeni]PZD84495.1 flagellar hook-basal body protein [Bacilli bacterium]PZD86766.1 flagellar hook-basal body protein [Bacilli bacterium]